MEKTTIICRSNKKANLYNQQIRKNIIWKDNEIAAGDMIMAVRNNYYWIEDNIQSDFIANGDIFEGTWVDNLRNGFFVKRFADGKRFEI